MLQKFRQTSWGEVVYIPLLTPKVLSHHPTGGVFKAQILLTPPSYYTSTKHFGRLADSTADSTFEQKVTPEKKWRSFEAPHVFFAFYSRNMFCGRSQASEAQERFGCFFLGWNTNISRCSRDFFLVVIHVTRILQSYNVEGNIPYIPIVVELGFV